ncbi:hypothetical protein [Candidatus Harpocratesius sp.]
MINDKNDCDESVLFKKTGFSFKNNPKLKDIKFPFLFGYIGINIFLFLIIDMHFAGNFIFCLVIFTISTSIINALFFVTISVIDGLSSPIQKFAENYELQRITLKRRVRVFIIQSILLISIEMIIAFITHRTVPIFKQSPIYDYVPISAVFWINFIVLETIACLIIWLSLTFLIACFIKL